ncbi:MAG: hypothetical protein KAS04_03135 [Candidatus Aenigmarchaeota archaeon]|nr:hypothetical protein [Candidatus Aenigmarchaeota archaeon]
MNRILTEKVKAEMLNFGMDLVGFGPVRRWENAPYLMSPKAILPESQTVIVGAISITDTWTELGGEPTPHDMGPGGWLDHNTFLDRSAYRVVRMLNDNGYKAIAVASSNIWRYRAFEDIPSLFAPDLSHIHAATAAGLAEIGWSGLAITPEFGNRCRFISIVTDAELVPTPMYDGPPLCDRCGDCIRNCPSMALKKDFNSKEPHVVKIGGKTYKYANKNIWCCAWAEHFDLNLDSETLKEDGTINEQTILDEMHSKGKRSHERGVCQKVCIPPHLRTRQPSFGRPDKTISMNRINKRYPDSMPTLRKMRDDISAFAVKLGIDLVSFAPLQFDAEISKVVMQENPGACTVIAFASHTLKDDKQVQENYVYDKAAFMLMHHNMIRLIKLIESYGYSAASYKQGAHCGINDKELAAMTDLGEIRDNNLFTEFGLNQVTGVIITNSSVDTSNKIHQKLEQSSVKKLTGKNCDTNLKTWLQKSLLVYLE